MIKLTENQRQLLAKVAAGRSLVNGDENIRQWWVDGELSAHAGTATSLVRHRFVEYFRHEGGQPGVDFYRLTDLGSAALK